MHLCVPAKKKQWGRPPRRVKRENEKKTMNEFFLAVFVLKEKKRKTEPLKSFVDKSSAAADVVVVAFRANGAICETEVGAGGGGGSS